MAHKVRGQWGVRKGIHFSLSLAAFNAEVEAELHCTLFVSVFCWLFEGSRYQRSPFDWSVLGDTAQADMGCTRTFCKSQIVKALLRSHSKEDHEINVLGCLVNLPMKFLGHNSMNNLDHGMVRVVISTINRYQQVEDLFDQQQSFYFKGNQQSCQPPHVKSRQKIQPDCWWEHVTSHRKARPTPLGRNCACSCLCELNISTFQHFGHCRF
jgi:hypothetical protein